MSSIVARLCGELCRTHNRYGWLIDKATRANEATCALLGKLCNTGDLEMPRGVSPLVAEKYHTHAPDCPNQPHPPVRPEEGEMFTAREQKGDGMRRRSPRRRVAMVTPKVNTRFAQVTRPHEGEEILLREWRMLPPPLSSTPKSSRTPSMSVVTAPLEGALRWDEEESDVSHVLSPVARVPRLPTTTPPSTNAASHRVTALEKEVMALKEMLQNEFWKPNASSLVSPRIAISDKSKTSQTPPVHETNPIKTQTHTSTSQTFLGTELEDDRVEEAIRYRHEGDVNDKAEQWIRGLRGDKLKPMAKAMGRVVAASTYNGEPNPTAFTAWKESIYSILPMYDVPPGPSQVQVATWFIGGKAKEWWTGVCASKEYGDMQTLESFFESIQMQFQPHDAPEQCMLKWVTLKQTGSVTEYMNQVDQLHNTWRLCQKAEFGLAMLGLKE